MIVEFVVGGEEDERQVHLQKSWVWGLCEAAAATRRAKREIKRRGKRGNGGRIAAAAAAAVVESVVGDEYLRMMMIECQARALPLE